MNLLFRLFYTLFIFRFRKPSPALGPCRTHFRCWPTDLDLLIHMNNGKYFSLMDIARIDMMGRSGLLKKFNNNKWYPVVVAETIRFSKSIKPFRKFEIETQVIGWDEKAVLLQQRFYCNNELYTEAIVRSRFLKKSGGSVTTKELLEAIPMKKDSPKMPDWIEAWNKAQV